MELEGATPPDFEMYERLSDVPEPIRYMFAEESSQVVIGYKPVYELVDGEEVFTRSPVYDTQWNVYRKTGERKGLKDIEAVVKRNKPQELIKRFYEMYCFAKDDDFVNEWFDWQDAEPEQFDFIDEWGYIDLNEFDQAHQRWLASEPKQPAHATFDEFFPTVDGYSYYMKLIGIEFDGVMCSATAEDMWGLSAIESYVRMGVPTPFKFDNGNKLVLTTDNIDAFYQTWAPYRASFFE